MNKIKIIFLFVMFVGISNAFALKGKCDISGKITNPNNDSILVKDDDGNIIQACRLDKKNKFAIHLVVEEGYYIVSDETEQTTVYLSPGFNLFLTIDTKHFDESITYTGKGSAENNYLAQSYLLDESLEKQKSYYYYANLNESTFLKLSDSVLQVELNLLEKYKMDQQSTFYEFEKMKLQYTYYTKLYNYESMHSMLTNNFKFKVSENYPDPFKNIELNKVAWIGAYQYTNVIQSYLEKLAGIDVKEKRDSDYYVAFYKHMEELVTLPKLKEKFAYNIGLYRMIYSKDIDNVFKYSMANLNDSNKRKEVESVYIRIKAMRTGTLIPKFAFKDLNGKTVQLSDFKGKFVYIDIWATWCGPCVYEVPHLKKLHDTLIGKNIELISICKDDYEQNWRNFIAKKELKGAQLFAEENQKEFFDDFIVSGIPRFILLDKEGKIIDYEAKRPSDPALLEQLLKLLN